MTDTSDGGSPAPQAAGQRGVSESIRVAGRTSWAIIGIGLVAAAVVASFTYTRAVTVPLVLSVVLAIIFQPVTEWLMARGASRGLAAAGALIFLLLVLIGVAALVAGTLVANWSEMSANLSDAATKIDDFLSNTRLSNNLGTQTKASADSAGPALATGVGSGATSAINSVAGLVVGLFFSLWVTFYVLQGGYLKERSDADADADKKSSTWVELFQYARTSIRGYFTSLTIIGAVNGFLIALAMLVMGIPGAVAVGIVNLFGSYIPYVGALIGGALAVLLALAEGGPTAALIMLVVVLLVQNTLQNIVQPKITSHYVSLSPLAVLLVTALGGVLAGLVGVILAVPFAAIAGEAIRLTRRDEGAPAIAAADGNSS
jgi:predicted PurR-regulated permease PerM